MMVKSVPGKEGGPGRRCKTPRFATWGLEDGGFQ